MSIVYLNGEFLPLSEARVSVLDRGFTFADGVYEVVPVFSDKLLRLQEHLLRLQNSLNYIFIDNPHTDEEWRAILEQLLSRNGLQGDQSLYIQVTRGLDEREHLYSDDLQPTVFAMCRKIQEKKDLSKGVSAISHEDIRWKYCHIKSIALLPGVLLKKRAKETDGSMEAILIRDGYVTEGASSNVFVVKNGTVKTPRKDNHVLPGITRDLIVELLNDNDIVCEENEITEDELKQADEIWLTSSTLGVAPVVKLDGDAVGSGNTGEVWKKVDTLYRAFKVSPPEM